MSLTFWLAVTLHCYLQRFTPRLSSLVFYSRHTYSMRVKKVRNEPADSHFGHRTPDHPNVATKGPTGHLFICRPIIHLLSADDLLCREITNQRVGKSPALSPSACAYPPTPRPPPFPPLRSCLRPGCLSIIRSACVFVQKNYGGIKNAKVSNVALLVERLQKNLCKNRIQYLL